uniref:Peptidase C1A papain C-terminal domain-containing protein n=1 Tax=Romanomermis culicivorax TaxID=13658 RepID=A0A915L2P9_ROMCU
MNPHKLIEPLFFKKSHHCMVVIFDLFFEWGWGFCLLTPPRFKRDDSSFASNVGGPVAKTDKNSTTTTTSRSLGGDEPYNDLEPCEMDQQTADDCRRFKRDDASFASNFGGPIAKSGKNETSGSSRKCNNEKKVDTTTNNNNNNNNNRGKWKMLTKIERRVSYGQQRRPLQFWPNLRWKRQLNSSLGAIASQSAMAANNNPPNLPARNTMPKPEEKLVQKLTNDDKDLDSKFGQCLAKTGRKLAEKVKKSDILELFKKNLEKVKQLRENRLSPFDAQFDEAGKFCDLPFDDFVKSHTGVKLPDLTNIRQIPSTAIIKKPNAPKLQWTAKNVFGAARDQGSCGSCYAMSTADILAAQAKIESKNFDQSLKRLSAQYMVDCLQEPDAFKCDGGRPINIVDDLARCQKNNKTGYCMLPEEDCYPYRNSSGQCKKTCQPISSAEMLDIRGPSEKNIMANLLQWGPVLAIVGVTDAWQFYNGSGVIRRRQCTQEQMHAVLVTGYDYTTCVPTYTVRNSWGADWGGKGYVKLEAGKNTCSVAKSVMYVCSSECGTTGRNFEYVTSNPNFSQD